jgi:hypothetical protein
MTQRILEVQRHRPFGLTEHVVFNRRRRIPQLRTLRLAGTLLFWACKADHPTAPPAPPVPFVMTVTFGYSAYPAVCHFTGSLFNTVNGGQLLAQPNGKAATLNRYIPLGQSVVDTLWLPGDNMPKPVMWLYTAYLETGVSSPTWDTSGYIAVTGPYAGTFSC